MKRWLQRLEARSLLVGLLCGGLLAVGIMLFAESLGLRALPEQRIAQAYTAAQKRYFDCLERNWITILQESFVPSEGEGVKGGYILFPPVEKAWSSVPSHLADKYCSKERVSFDSASNAFGLFIRHHNDPR